MFLVSVVINKHWVTESFCNIMDAFSLGIGTKNSLELTSWESLLELVQGEQRVSWECELRGLMGPGSPILLLPDKTLPTGLSLKASGSVFVQIRLPAAMRESEREKMSEERKELFDYYFIILLTVTTIWSRLALMFRDPSINRVFRAYLIIE